MNDLYAIPVKTLDGRETTLAEHRGKVMLFVNVASRCGFTPQYAGLEQLYADGQETGLVVLGFPCNQFGAQEPGTAEEIAEFCDTSYGVTFPMYEKVDVNGPGTHPIYQLLKSAADGGDIQWNFEKFVVGRDGTVVGRFPSSARPDQLAEEIEPLLSQG